MQMLRLHNDFAKARNEYEKTVLRNQIAATDRLIDALAFELHGLLRRRSGPWKRNDDRASQNENTGLPPIRQECG